MTISLIQIYRLISRFSTYLTISSLCRMNNDLFADNSWYSRNALIRANYRNVRKEVEPDMSFLNLFFRNLMMGENHELKNRYIIINTPQQSIEQVPNNSPPHYYCQLFDTSYSKWLCCSSLP